MADATLVYVFYPCNELLVEFASLSLLESLVRDYVVEELPTLAELHNQEKLLLCFDYLNN